MTNTKNTIINLIKVASENNPLKPEFPPENPKFPATTIYRIKVPGFSNVWLKDESSNLTGTHKDRMAWEIVVTYKDFLKEEAKGNIKKLPVMSIISSGSAAFAIQTKFKEYNLPNLKVLLDTNTNKKIIKILKKIGCKIYKTDLSKEVLNSREILKLTKNTNGFDITSADALDPTTKFYDWLSYEIINESPEYCFIPFGTGNLYENILNINKKEISSRKKDPRFIGNISKLKKCNFIGATTNNPKSKMALKLYSPHLPFTHFNEQWIEIFKKRGFCGKESNVFNLKEKYLDQAIEIAKINKINCEPSGIAGLGMLLQLKNQIPKKAKIVIVNTGKSKASIE